MLRLKSSLTAFLLLGLAAAVASSAGAATTTQYAGASTIVAREGNQTVFDNGLLVCSAQVQDASWFLFGQDTRTGGACLPFDPDGTVLVQDPSLPDPDEVAYQVCVDNNQDKQCSLIESPGWDPFCPDWVRFSHKGPPDAWANPMGSLPTALLAGGTCPGPQPGAWDGLLVFICSGAHDAHEHVTSGGSITTGGNGAPGFEIFVDQDVYCGPPPGVPAVKAYTLT
jgi:hypothetical protein